MTKVDRRGEVGVPAKGVSGVTVALWSANLWSVVTRLFLRASSLKYVMLVRSDICRL
jgi:hypothetical protein